MMPPLTYLTVYLHSIAKSTLISSVIEPLHPLFFLENYKNRYFYIVIQLLMRIFRKNAIRKNFPLITVIGPSGPITHCYESSQVQINVKKYRYL